MFSQPRAIYTNFVLTAIALFLAILALSPILAPAHVQAQSTTYDSFYVEPGTTLLRKPDGSIQVEGKVMINLKTGEIWGFPTFTNTPYPVNSTGAKPPVSEPMYLGRFNLGAAKRTP
jgi:hypothetical protein